MKLKGHSVAHRVCDGSKGADQRSDQDRRWAVKNPELTANADDGVFVPLGREILARPNSRQVKTLRREATAPLRDDIKARSAEQK